MDLTNDLGIPVIAAVSHKKNMKEGKAEQIIFGFGCHIDPRIAVQRAVTEIAQSLPFIIKLNNKTDSTHKTQEFDSELHRWLTSATLTQHPYFLPHSDIAPRRLENFPLRDSKDVLSAINICRESVEKLGMEVLVMNQTRTEIGMPSAKVIVPGLRHFWARLGPGRLYDVPVKMGLLKTPMAETELNPTPMFL